MSDFKVFVGDAELPMDETTMELNLESSLNRASLVEYLASRRDATATFEITDPAWEHVFDWGLGDRRTLELTNEYPLVWSRWRRWVNAVLRFAWWPLGPASLPETATASVTIPDMRIERIRGGVGAPLQVEMSNRPD